MAYSVTLIRGDGIRPEVAKATQTVIDATGVKIDWTIEDAGVDVMATHGTPLPDRVLESVRKTVGTQEMAEAIASKVAP